MEVLECEKEIQALDSEIEQLESDMMRGIQGIRLNRSDVLSLQEDQLRQLEEIDTSVGRMKSANVAIAASIARIQRELEAAPFDIHFPSGVRSGFRSHREISERTLVFETVEEETRFFARKILDSYNEANPSTALILKEAIKSNKVESCCSSYVHLNCIVKDINGDVRLFFAEATASPEPVVLSHSFLDLGDSGDYGHHQRGCGGGRGCDPDAPDPMYHPRGGYLYGN